MFIALEELIHKAIIIYDGELKDFKLKGKDKSFMSGVKHIDNLVKHNTEKIEILDIISSTPKIQSEKVNGMAKNRFRVNMELVNFWNDIKDIPCDDKWMNQRNNYNIHLKGKLVIDTVQCINLIIEKYCNIQRV